MLTQLFTGTHNWLYHARPLVLVISLAGNLMYLLIPWTRMLASQDSDYGWLMHVIVGLLALWVGNEALKKWYNLLTLPHAQTGGGTATLPDYVSRFYNWVIQQPLLYGGFWMLLLM